MEQKRRLYPVGYQDFKQIRNEERLYIDKTEYIYRMAHGDSKYYFLSRPRRFGKTLLTSTLQYYFEGRKELFAGLAIDKLETEWTTYPVLRFDLSRCKGLTKDELPRALGAQISKYEALYGKNEAEEALGDRLAGVIERAYKQTKQPAVVLIDEYDSPLLEVVHEEDNLKDMRRTMKNFYSPLKACDPYLRFVFLTGITKFAQLSIFSELNNIRDISMNRAYAGICGITKEELKEQMAEDISLLGESLGLTAEKTLEQLVQFYDGYHFTWPSPDIFNPYSLFNAFADETLDSYWFGTGTPTYLINMLQKYDILPTQIGPMQVDVDGFNTPVETAVDHIPLFYQSGYLTIKDFDGELYTLDIPNKEVRQGLMKNLLTSYVPTLGGVKRSKTLSNLRQALAQDDMNKALTILRDFFASLPFTKNTNYEGHYQQLMYVMLSLTIAEVDVEQHSAAGIMDLVVRTKRRIFILELKLNKTAEQAMQQIDDKDYAARYADYGLPITKIGVNFDSEKRTIGSWTTEDAVTR